MYGQFLSHEEVGSLVTPEAAQVATALAWLRSVGASNIQLSPHREFVHATITAAAAQHAFGKELGGLVEFRHALTGAKTVRFEAARAAGSTAGSSLTRDVLRATAQSAEAAEVLVEGVELVSGLWELPIVSTSVAGSRQRVRNRRAAAVLAAMSPRSLSTSKLPPKPVIGLGEGANEEIVLGILPFLTGGSGVASKEALMAHYSGFEVTATPADPTSSAPTRTLMVPSEQITGFGGPLWALAFTGVANYVRYNISVVAHYFGNSTAAPPTPLPPATMAPGMYAVARPWSLPASVRKLAHVPEGFQASSSNTTAGVILWGGQYFNMTELANFLADVGEAPPKHTRLVDPHSENNPSLPGDEGQMDIELITGTATGASTTFWYASNNMDFGLLNWTAQVAAMQSPPLVFSCSWGTAETEVGPLGSSFESRISTEFQKIGLRGITLLFASGDAGATAAGRGGNCSDFQPSFPATSPYAVAVSATVMSGDTQSPPAPANADSIPFCAEKVYNASVVCNGPSAFDMAQQVAVSCCDDGEFWTTGGGFSSIYARPKWQEAPVKAWLARAEAAGQLPASHLTWNRTNRGYPDVSALGDQVLVNIGGHLSISGGTSSATPFTAGIVALLNDVRFSTGQPPLGPILPWLYAAYGDQPSVVTDVTVGNNLNGEFKECNAGYYATQGWDPVTGLGVLRFDVLAARIRSEARRKL